MIGFLLEIGVEEIPDWMIAPALNGLQDSFQSLLNSQGIGGMVTAVDATPRRLTLRASGLKPRQEDSEELVLGPPKSAGPGAAGGFAKKMGVAAADLGTEANAKGEYFSYRKRTAGRPASEILAETLPALILKIYFPKTMYWNGKGTERFIRPIRWVVALLGTETVSFRIGPVHSANHTEGHRILGRRSIAVDLANYETELAANGVIVSAKARRERIETQIAALLAGRNLRVKPDESLLDTLVYITEIPTPILGSFDPSYLTLPQEILVEVMRYHQKYFSVLEEDGALAPHFLAVMNTDGDPDGLVRHGNERVLRARFNDARFFYGVDQKKPLADRVADLANVTFQAKVGSYLEKTNRLVELVKRFGGGPDAQRAAHLAKTDLTTEMVKEFTDLQGVIGGLYAKAQGESEATSQAIYHHYKPLSMDGEIPRTPDAQVLSVADKWDTLVECFNAGLIPSGSKDPFALRRAAQGIVRIIVEGKLPIRLEPANSALQEFLRDRIDYYFREVRGFKYDEVRACAAAGAADLIDLESRLERVQAIRATPDFEPLAAAFKRIKNILTQAALATDSPIDEALLEDGPERDLYDENLRHGGEAIEARIAALRPKVDLFFDKVLVNAKDEAVRINRLTLLKSLLTEFSTIADFSEIVTGKI